MLTLLGDNGFIDRIARAKWYEVCFISGHTLKYTVRRVKGFSEQDAIDEAFYAEGDNFENRLVSVKEILV